MIFVPSGVLCNHYSIWGNPGKCRETTTIKYKRVQIMGPGCEAVHRAKSWQLVLCKTTTSPIASTFPDVLYRHVVGKTPLLLLLLITTIVYF